MRKLFAPILVVSGALLSVGCPRFHAECVGGEWSKTVTSSRISNQSNQVGSSSDNAQGCEYWLCRDGYLRQGDSCVQECDSSEYVANGRWCVRKCPQGQWAKDDSCVATCGKNWLYKEDSRQCVEWCEEGYAPEGEKCVKVQ